MFGLVLLPSGLLLGSFGFWTMNWRAGLLGTALVLLGLLAFHFTFDE